MLKTLNIQSISLMLIISAIAMFSSCNTNKYLKDGEQYVATSKYKIQADQKIKGKNDLQFELSTLEKQKPNKKFLGLARMGLWQHYRVQSKKDSSELNKWNKWIEKVIAEQPSILDSLQTVESAENMTISLKRRGYFDAEVSYDITRKKNTAYSSYDVNLKSLYTIDTTTLTSKDTAVIRLIDRELDNSFLKNGAAVSFENYQKERTRIRTILRNNGFAKFQTNYITRFRGDSTSTDKHKVKIEYDIITPTDTTYHQKYYVGDIVIIPEYSPDATLSYTQDSVIGKYTFRTDGKPMKVKPKVLLENIFLNKGDLYRQRNQDKTSLQISNLGLYRFVTVKPIFNENEPGVIDFEIYLSMNKKLALSIGAEINNTNRTATATSLVGTALSFNWRNRNLFKGAELLLLNVEGGFELNPGTDNRIISNVNFSTEVNLQIPRFNDYFGFWKAFGGKGRKNNREGFYNKLVDNANSEFSTRFNYVDLNNAYTFRSFEISYGVNINNLNGKTWNIDHIGIDYLVPTIDPAFESIAPEILKRSLVRQFLTGFLIPKEVSKKTIWRLPIKDVTKNFTWHVEHSGLEAHAYDKISGGDPLTLGNSILSKFLLGTLEYSRTKRINQGNSFAYKFFAGGVKSYGDAQVVPFVKQFNGGGANSTRAWRLYELGPGTYRDPAIDASRDTVNIIQTANFKLELNAEYRFDITGRFKSAFFIDAGNIWTFDEDMERPGAKFNGLSSLGDLAISVGTGLRMDFTYFIFRVDVGFKFRTPYINYSGNNYTPLKDYLKRKNRYISIALGYPF